VADEEYLPEETKVISSYGLRRMTNFSATRAIIWLYSGDDGFARLAFLGPEVEVPKKLEVKDYEGREVLWIYYPIEAYRDVVDMLRNEKPVRLTYQKSAGYAHLDTGKEPVGEEEARGGHPA
jgi:hypothetical protein